MLIKFCREGCLCVALISVDVGIHKVEAYHSELIKNTISVLLLNN